MATKKKPKIVIFTGVDVVTVKRRTLPSKGKSVLARKKAAKKATKKAAKKAMRK